MLVETVFAQLRMKLEAAGFRVSEVSKGCDRSTMFSAVSGDTAAIVAMIPHEKLLCLCISQPGKTRDIKVPVGIDDQEPEEVADAIIAQHLGGAA